MLLHRLLLPLHFAVTVVLPAFANGTVERSTRRGLARLYDTSCRACALSDETELENNERVICDYTCFENAEVDSTGCNWNDQGPQCRLCSIDPKKGQFECPKCSQIWERCGGESWTGPTCCAEGLYCVKASPEYSQCLPPGTAAPEQTAAPTVAPVATAKPVTAKPVTAKPVTPPIDPDAAEPNEGEGGEGGSGEVTFAPTMSPTMSPTGNPTAIETEEPVVVTPPLPPIPATKAPTSAPVTKAPTAAPTVAPTAAATTARPITAAPTTAAPTTAAPTTAAPTAPQCLTVGTACSNSTAAAAAAEGQTECCEALQCVRQGALNSTAFACVNTATASLATLTLTVAAHTGNVCSTAVAEAAAGAVSSGLCPSGCAVTSGTVTNCVKSGGDTPPPSTNRRLQNADVCSNVATDACDVSVALNLQFYATAAGATAADTTAAGLNAFTTATGYTALSKSLGVPPENMGVSPIAVSGNPDQPLAKSETIATSGQSTSPFRVVPDLVRDLGAKNYWLFALIGCIIALLWAACAYSTFRTVKQKRLLKRLSYSSQKKQHLAPLTEEELHDLDKNSNSDAPYDDVVDDVVDSDDDEHVAGLTTDDEFTTAATALGGKNSSTQQHYHSRAKLRAQKQSAKALDMHQQKLSEAKVEKIIDALMAQAEEKATAKDIEAQSHLKEHAEVYTEYGEPYATPPARLASTATAAAAAAAAAAANTASTAAATVATIDPSAAVHADSSESNPSTAGSSSDVPTAGSAARRKFDFNTPMFDAHDTSLFEGAVSPMSVTPERRATAAVPAIVTPERSEFYDCRESVSPLTDPEQQHTRGGTAALI